MFHVRFIWRLRAKLRLLMAAPDLYKALKANLACLESWVEIADERDLRDYDQEAIGAAYRAIWKAGGRLPDRVDPLVAIVGTVLP